ncbi:MAG TPA: HD domain-containing protein [Thermotogota bacterium]|nr:HD domain-containing protein [Thermotogota bacterium]
MPKKEKRLGGGRNGLIDFWIPSPIKSLKSKLLLTLLPTVFILLSLFAWLLVWGLTNLETQGAVAQSREILKAKSENASEWFVAIGEELKNVSYLLVEEMENPSLDHPYIRYLLNRSPVKFESFVYVDSKGHALHSLGYVLNEYENPYFLETARKLEEFVFSGPDTSQLSGKPVLEIWKAVVDRNGAYCGAIKAAVYLDYFTELATGLHFTGRGIGWVIREDGLIVSQLSSSPLRDLSARRAPDDGAFALHENDSKLLLQALRTRRGGYQEVSSPTGSKDVLIYEPIANSPGWFLGVTIGKSLFFEDRQRVVGYILAVFFVLSVCIVLSLLYVSKKLTAPLQALEKDIQKYGRGDLSVRVQPTGYREVLTIGRVFNEIAGRTERDFLRQEDMNQQLREANEELEYANLQLQETGEQQHQSMTRLNEIIALTASLSESVIRKDESFLGNLLEMLMKLIPVTDYGSISVINKEKWRFVHAVGHNLAALKALDLRSGYLFWKTEPIIVSDLLSAENNVLVPPDLLEKIRKATRPIRLSIVCRLSLGTEKLGSIALDIAKENPIDFSPSDLNIASAFSNVASAFLALQRYMISQGKFQKELLLSMIKILEFIDPYTKGHSENVATYCARIGEALQWPKEYITRIYWAGLVHDIGKILVPMAVLRKESPLTEEEFETIKQHPVWGAEVLKTSEELEDIADAVLYHHERWGGGGYPEGLYGEEIPLFSRVISVADAYDSMTSNRPYREALSDWEAVREIERNLATQFDPDIGRCFIQIMVREKKIRNIL